MTELQQPHDGAAAYALDALDTPERAEFEQHLSGCASCRREVAELSEVGAELALAADLTPPPALRDAVLAGIVGVEQLAPLPGRPRRALVAVETDDAEPEAAVDAPVAAADPVADELALRRASRRTRVLTLLVAAVTVVALALGGVVISLVRHDQDAPIAAAQVDPALLSAPDAKIYATTLTNGAQVSFVVSKGRNEAAFVGADLPSPGAGNVYHLWTLKANVPTPDRTLPGGAESTQTFSGPVDSVDQLAVNIEAAGTNPTSPTNPVLGGVRI